MRSTFTRGGVCPRLSLVFVVAAALLVGGCAIEQGGQGDTLDVNTGTGGFIKPDIQVSQDTGGSQDAGAQSDSGGGTTDAGGATDAGGSGGDTGSVDPKDAGSVDPKDAGNAGGDTGSVDPKDTGAGNDDTGSGAEDADQQDTGAPDAGPEDTGPQGCKAADPKSCDDGKPCTQDVCDEPTGECAHIPLPAGTPCDGGFVCSASVCQTNIGCVPSGDKKKCDDGVPCTVDECIEGKGCTSKEGGNAPCDDGDPCTKFDHCKDGKCGGQLDNCDDGWACTKDNCDKAAGCKHEIQLSGPCDDNNACTKNTECVNGDCKGPVTPCDDGNSCTKDVCDPKKGCDYVKLDKILCDDGDACTINTACHQGTCSGEKRDCNDGKSCTEDTCDPKKGCNSALKKDGAACLLGGQCSKGICSSMLTCGNGKLDQGETCDDGNKNPCDNCNNTCSGSNAGQKLQGTATIGNGGQYKTINQAIAALKTCGVQGPTTFIVLPGTYNESAGFDMPNISTASEKAPITFRGDPTGKVSLVGSVAGSSYTGTIRFQSGAHDITVEGFDIDGQQSANKVKTSHCGVVVFQTGTAQKRIRIRGMNIHDFNTSAWGSYTYVAGVYLPSMGQPYEDIRIENNRFTNLYPQSTYSRQGVIFSYYPRIKGLRITGNYFAGNQMMAPITLYYGYQLEDFLVANNMMVVQYGYGLYLYRVANIANDGYVAFNTMLMTNASYGMYAYYWNYNSNTQGKLVFRNNIIASLSGAKKALYMYPNNQNVLGNAGNNCLFNAAWDYGGSNVTGNPDFKSLSFPYDLHISKSSPCANKGSLDIPGVTHDFDGDLRSESPDIGADEVK